MNTDQLAHILRKQIATAEIAGATAFEVEVIIKAAIDKAYVEGKKDGYTICMREWKSGQNSHAAQGSEK